ncbi:hypothetical protein VdG2_08757 [Verticillium dahliae VDG2]|nr:hypothetical protein VdG2_08757 [Verticillium dahliae VDG2]
MPVHHLMIGTWTPPGAIFTVAFDDEKLTLELVKRTEIPQDEPISWMTFDHKKKNIYGAAMKKWSSYAVESPTSITHTASHPMTHEPEASSASTNTRAIFLLAAQKPPYAVYANPFYNHAGHGTVYGVDEAGPLAADPVHHFPLDPHSGIHGSVFDPTESYLYSADLRANKIWTHAKDPVTGALTLVDGQAAPDAGDHPRWTAMHPSGTHLYALMEASNKIRVYRINPTTHVPEYTGAHYPLIPPGIPNPKTMYRADVCALTQSGRYLFASSRANDFGLTGYIAAFKLRDDGEIERQICLNPTPTSGGHSNAVAPCDWSDEWVAITDDQEGWLDMYRWQDEFLARVARLRIPEPGFGMNAIWYD